MDLRIEDAIRNLGCRYLSDAGFHKAGTTNRPESWMPGLERCRNLGCRDSNGAGFSKAGTTNKTESWMLGPERCRVIESRDMKAGVSRSVKAVGRDCHRP